MIPREIGGFVPFDQVFSQAKDSKSWP